MATEYRPFPNDPDQPGFYRIDETPGGYRWVWSEPGQPDDISPVYKTRARALRAAASDWEQTAGTSLPRFVGMLRALATRAERTGA